MLATFQSLALLSTAMAALLLVVRPRRAQAPVRARRK